MRCNTTNAALQPAYALTNVTPQWADANASLVLSPKADETRLSNTAATQVQTQVQSKQLSNANAIESTMQVQTQAQLKCKHNGNNMQTQWQQHAGTP